MLRITCPHCGHVNTFPANYAERSFACKGRGCTARLAVPPQLPAIPPDSITPSRPALLAIPVCPPVQSFDFNAPAPAKPASRGPILIVAIILSALISGLGVAGWFIATRQDIGAVVAAPKTTSNSKPKTKIGMPPPVIPVQQKPFSNEDGITSNPKVAVSPPVARDTNLGDFRAFFRTVQTINREYLADNVPLSRETIAMTIASREAFAKLAQPIPGSPQDDLVEHGRKWLQDIDLNNALLSRYYEAIGKNWLEQARDLRATIVANAKDSRESIEAIGEKIGALANQGRLKAYNQKLKRVADLAAAEQKRREELAAAEAERAREVELARHAQREAAAIAERKRAQEAQKKIDEAIAKKKARENAISARPLAILKDGTEPWTYPYGATFERRRLVATDIKSEFKFDDNNEEILHISWVDTNFKSNIFQQRLNAEKGKMEPEGPLFGRVEAEFTINKANQPVFRLLTIRPIRLLATAESKIADTSRLYGWFAKLRDLK
jgi:hypothetical protein